MGFHVKEVGFNEPVTLCTGKFDTYSWCYLFFIPSSSPASVFFVGGLLRLRWAFLGTLTWLVPVLLSRFLNSFREMYWQPQSSSLIPNLFYPLAWGVAFIRLIFLVPPRVTIRRSLPCKISNRASLVARLLGAFLAYPVLRGCLFASAFLLRLLNFRLSEWISMSKFLQKSCPFPLRLTDVAGPVVALLRKRRRVKVLVLVKTISTPYYLFFY